MTTIYDIAEKAGVSSRTAARVLAGMTQGKRSDAKERAERVLKIAQKLGYQPSNVAQALRNGKTNTIGMVIGGVSNKYFGCMIEAFLDELDKYDYRLLLEVTKWDEAKEYECLKDLLRHRVDGIIYLCDLPVNMAQEHQMMLDKNFTLMTIATNDYGFGMVKNDFTPAISSATKFLYNRKKRDIGFVLHHGHRLQNIEMEKAFTTICEVLEINGSVYHLGPGNRIEEIINKRHQAWLIDGPNTLNRIMDDFSSKSPEYKPDVIGFYDDFNWELRHESICGAVIRQTGKIIEEVVKEIITRIENNNMGKRTNIEFAAEFSSADNFKHLKFKKAPSEYNV